MAKYSSISPNILSHVSNNIPKIFCSHQYNILKNICSCSHVHQITSLSLSNATAFLVGKSCVEGKETEWEGEGGFITCASRFIFRLLNIQITSAICDWNNVAPRT
jgi:hypothetical protein